MDILLKIFVQHSPIVFLDQCFIELDLLCVYHLLYHLLLQQVDKQPSLQLILTFDSMDNFCQLDQYCMDSLLRIFELHLPIFYLEWCYLEFILLDVYHL